MNAVSKTFLFIGIVLISFLAAILIQVTGEGQGSSEFKEEFLAGNNGELSVLLGEYTATGYYEENKADGTVLAEVTIGEVVFFVTFAEEKVKTIDYAINCSSTKATNEEFSNKCYLQEVYPENTLSIQ